MKIRTDFVTNSSSSSFIIGKKGDINVTIESVFNTIKGFYIELNEKLEAAKQYCKDNESYPIMYDAGNNCFRFKEKRTYDKKEREIEKDFERNFGIDTFSYIYGGIDWFKCNSYKEYEEYWINEKSLDSKKIAPFEIYDYLSPGKMKQLMWGTEEIEKNIGPDNDELQWYYPCIDELFKNKNHCDVCSSKDYCGKDDAEEALNALSANTDLTEDNICLNLLGRVCISSECGYIPEYVVEKLSEISEYSCNHMG